MSSSISNGEIVHMMLNTAGTVVERTKHIVSLLAEKYNLSYDSLAVSKWMERMWEDRRKLLRKKDNEKLLNDWLSKSFIYFSNKENCPPSPEMGRPRKKLSDNPCLKLENSILNSIIELLEAATRGQNVSNKDLLLKLIKRSETKWRDLDHKRSSSLSMPV